MSDSNTSHNIPHTDWQMLAELDLPVDSSTEDALRAWLSAVLEPLRLHAHFRNQVVQSAQDIAGRAMTSKGTVQFGHLNFCVFAPKQPASNGQTWGFFQWEP